MASRVPGCSTSTKAKRLLKCFCGCKELTEDEVKRIYRLNTQETLINTLAKELFQKYLENERGTCDDKSETENNLIIYELCEQMIVELKDRIITEDEVATLSESGLQYNLEKELETNVKTGDPFRIEMCLRRIQAHCRNEIEASNEYKQFKQAILNKLKNAHK